MAKIISAGKVRRKAVKAAAKGVKKATSKKKKGSRKLYTEDEKKKLRNLRAKAKRLEKKRKDILDKAVWNKLTLQDMRPKLGDDTARKLYYEGFFDENNKDNYENRDFAEWYLDNIEAKNDMREEWSLTEVEKDLDYGFEELQSIFDEYDVLCNIDSATNYGEKLAAKKLFERLDDKEFADVSTDLYNIREEIDKIQDNALKRKAERILKQKLAKEYGNDIAKMMEDMNKAYETGKKLTKGEREAWVIMKNLTAKAVLKEMKPWLSTLDPEQAAVIKKSVFSAISQNPLEGIKAGIKASVTNKISKKYGNPMAELGGILVDAAMSSGSGKNIAKGIGKGLVTYFAETKGLTPEAMEERAQELVAEGEAGIVTKNAIQFTVETAVEVAKDVIVTGGQIEATLPVVIKDLIENATKYTTRAHKEINEYKKAKNKTQNEMDEAKKYNEENPLTTQEFNQKFFDE